MISRDQTRTYSSSKANLAAFSSPGCCDRKGMILWYVQGICAFLARSIPKAFLRLPKIASAGKSTNLIWGGSDQTTHKLHGRFGYLVMSL